MEEQAKEHNRRHHADHGNGDWGSMRRAARFCKEEEGRGQAWERGSESQDTQDRMEGSRRLWEEEEAAREAAEIRRDGDIEAHVKDMEHVFEMELQRADAMAAQ